MIYFCVIVCFVIVSFINMKVEVILGLLIRICVGVFILFYL